MKKERKIIVYIATSADGYIARKDGSIDWLNYKRTAGDYGMGAFYGIDCVIPGRRRGRRIYYPRGADLSAKESPGPTKGSERSAPVVKQFKDGAKARQSRG